MASDQASTKLIEEKEAIINVGQNGADTKQRKRIICLDTYKKATWYFSWTRLIFTWSVLSFLVHGFNRCIALVENNERERLGEEAVYGEFLTHPLVLAVALIDLVLLLDIGLKCRTAYVDEAGALVTSPSKIGVHFCETGLLCADIFGSFPYALLVLTGLNPSICMLWGFMRIFRVFAGLPPGRRPLSPWELTMMSCVFFGVLSSFWAYVGYFNLSEGLGWMSVMARDADTNFHLNETTTSGRPTPVQMCTAAMHIATGSMFFSLNNSIRLDTDFENWLWFVSGFGALFAFAVFMAAIRHTIPMVWLTQNRRWGEFYRFYKVPWLISERIYDYTRDLSLDEPATPANLWIGRMPSVLKTDFAMWLSQFAFPAGTPLGRAFEAGSPESQLALRASMEFVHAPQNTRFLVAGYRLDSVYFVYRGKMEVWAGGMYRGEAETGHIFGDLAPGGYRCSRMAIVTTLDCDMLKLPTAKLLEFLYALPDHGARFFQEVDATSFLLTGIDTYPLVPLSIPWHNCSAPNSAGVEPPFRSFKQLDSADPKDMDAAALAAPGSQVPHRTSPSSCRGCTVEQLKGANGKVTYCIAAADEKSDQPPVDSTPEVATP